VTGHRPGTIRQVAALLGLRWRMLKAPLPRAAALLASSLLLVLVAIAPFVAMQVPSGFEVEVATLLAVLILLFPILVFMSGMAAGGGAEAVPAASLVAFPVSPRAVFALSVLLTPLNAAWTLQALSIVWLGAYVGVRGQAGLAGAGFAVGFVVASTVAGITLSWMVTGVRASWVGRRVTEGLLVAAAALIGWRVAADGAEQVLEALPLSDMAVAMVLPSATLQLTWVASLLIVLGVALAAGFWATAWTLGRPDDAADRREGRDHRRRRQPRTQLIALLATDISSIARSRPLRRGIVLFSLVPGAAALLSGMPWEDMVILPGLVGTGAALLFSVNAFALDSSGATWLESCPRDPRSAFASKATVAAGTTASICVGTLLVASARPRMAPELHDVLVLLLAVMTSVAITTAIAMRQSIVRPIKADLRSARDTPAPPLTMTMHSLRLIAATAVVGIGFVLAIRLPTVVPAVVISIAVVSVALVHLWQSSRMWQNRLRRIDVVTAVSTG